MLDPMSLPPLTVPAPARPSGIIDERCSSPGLLLALLGHVAMRQLRDAHTAEGLTPRQFYILGLLHDLGAISQRELAAMTRTDPSILVTMLNPLEADGLIVRRRDPADRRRHVVALTEDGERKLRRATQAHRAAEDELFASLDDAQREQLRQLLVIVQRGLAGGHDTPCSLLASSDECPPIQERPDVDDR